MKQTGMDTAETEDQRPALQISHLDVFLHIQPKHKVCLKVLFQREFEHVHHMIQPYLV